MEVLVDNFVVYETALEQCFYNLTMVLQRSKQTKLVLDWERCRFMVGDGIVFGHKISERGIEVDNSSMVTLEILPIPQDIKGVKNFLGNAGFYQRFIKDFAKVSRPLTYLLNKDTPFFLIEIVLILLNN